MEILRGCRVIEGFLVITLIESNYTAFGNTSFPELEEITDFFALFHVRGIRSLGKVFPNLRVIRGNNVLSNYAFIVFEMFGLQEIGLQNLRFIGRGSIRIEKNYELCFSDTIDWTAIAPHTSHKDHFIQKNRPANECPSCPSGKQIDDQPKEIDCPPSPYDPKKRLCWNRSMCQKSKFKTNVLDVLYTYKTVNFFSSACPTSCGNRTCNDSGVCCDESCIGSCYHDNVTDTNKCYVCRKFALGLFTNRECIDVCPKDMFSHYERRCVTADECHNVTRPFSVHPNDTFKYPYIPFNDTCSVSCPTGYDVMGESRTRYCLPCNGPCKKTCAAATVDSIASAQQFRGCTAIKGSLLIQIRSQGGREFVGRHYNALELMELILLSFFFLFRNFL